MERAESISRDSLETVRSVVNLLSSTDDSQRDPPLPGGADIVPLLDTEFHDARDNARLVRIRAALAVPRLRALWHVRLLRLPVVGALARGLNTARLAATLAILVGSRVPLLTSLRAGAGVVSNLPMKHALEEAATRVQEGASLSRSLGASRLFPPLMVHMIASGEASGRLGEMLERTATQSTRELERRIAAFVALLEPLLIIAMGGIVLAIVLAILLPIFELNQIVR